MNIDLLIDAASHEIGSVTAPRRMPHSALDKLLARGDAFDPPAMPLELALARLFDLPTEDASGHAALTLLGDGHDPGSDYWLRIDPVCLQAGRTRLALAPLPSQSLSQEEANELGAAISAHLAAAGHELVLADPQRWYLRCRGAPAMRTQSPEACTGALDEAHLPSGADSAPWRRLITEAQMLLHDLPVNSSREAAGELPVNAVWPWGGGRLPSFARQPYALVYADVPLARGLARATQAAVSAVPRDAAAFLQRATPGESTLIVLDARNQPENAYLAQLDRDWFEPLTAALADGRISQLKIMLRTGAGHNIGRVLVRSHLRRWWRRSRTHSGHA
jgi:hypothetical protein